MDQSGKLGGAELSLKDVAKFYQESCLVGLFADGPFRQLLEQQQIPVQVLATSPLLVRKDSSLVQSLSSIGTLVPLIAKVAKLANEYDLIYTNTQKAFVVGAIASFLTRRPLVHHLRDILCPDHFSQTNRRLVVMLANRFASLVIANSKATQAAFVEAGGQPDLIEVVYNGFEPERYQTSEADSAQIKQQLGLEGKFVVGHFSRLSPWKGQHILLQALVHCPEDVTAVLVGDAIFGEDDYVKLLHEQVVVLGLEQRVRFLGFRSDIALLMVACDMIAHTSTAPEPFGRVIVEAMLCGKPVVVAQAGGAVELVKDGETGWLVPPDDPLRLAEVITACHNYPDQATTIAHRAQVQARQRFNLEKTNKQLAQLLYESTGITKV